MSSGKPSEVPENLWCVVLQLFFAGCRLPDNFDPERIAAALFWQDDEAEH